MCQKDIDFITILNKMRLNKQSNSDIQYINDHCYRPAPIDPLFPYIYYKNKDVHKHNDKMLSLVKEKLLVIEAIDELESYQEPMLTYEKTITLPTRILVKQNMLVELYAGNYNIEDGLVNGVDGIFKAYTRKNKDVDVMWIEFTDTIIGQAQRKKHFQLYDKSIQSSWTPILRIAKPNATSTNKYQTTIRKQFPIQLACARTIHRTQGLTLSGLAFDPIGIT